MIISDSLDNIIEKLRNIILDKNNYICFYTSDVYEHALKLNKILNIDICEIKITLSIEDIISELNNLIATHTYIWSIIDNIYNKNIYNFITTNKVPIFINHFYNVNGIFLKISDDQANHNVLVTPKAFCQKILNNNLPLKMYLLHYKITNKSFFLSEYIEYIIYYKYYIDYHMDTDYFFTNLNELKQNIPELYNDQLFKIQMSIETNCFTIPSDIFYYRPNSTYKNYSSYEEIDQNIKVINLKVQRLKKSTRRIDFDIENTESDPYAYYMHNILHLKSKSLQQKFFKQLLLSIKEYVLNKEKIIIPKYIFNVGLEIFLDELRDNLLFSNDNFYYQNIILFFYVSDNFLNQIKNYCRNNNISQCYIASVKSYNIKLLKIRKIKKKSHLSVIY